MKRMLSVVVLAVAMLAVLAVPALAATPANNGVGQAYGDHHATRPGRRAREGHESGTPSRDIGLGHAPDAVT